MSEFNVIVAVDDDYGIAADGSIPWYVPEDVKWFRKKTMHSAIIMGRKTWESLTGPLKDRINIVLSKGILTAAGATVVDSFDKALLAAKDMPQIYVIGGAEIYAMALTHPLCHRVYLTRVSGTYKCDRFFPINLLSGYKMDKTMSLSKTATIYEYTYENYNEEQYLAVLSRLLSSPLHTNRTDVPARSNFAVHMRFDLLGGIIPLLTTKRVAYKCIYYELLWFLRGQTNIAHLHKNGVHIWDANATREFLDSRGLDYPEGELGPVYGKQWRDWGGSTKVDLDNRRLSGIDQIKQLIDGIRADPFSRRHIVSAWNVSELSAMALPPCHCFFQMVVEPNDSGQPAYLSCMLHQRSGDFFLGVPFNIASYALLTHMIARLTGLEAKELVVNIGDCHLYQTHDDAAHVQLIRRPHRFPTAVWSGIQQKIEDFDENSLAIIKYYPHESIRAPMAV